MNVGEMYSTAKGMLFVVSIVATMVATTMLTIVGVILTSI